MRCLNCGAKGIALETEICPQCGAYIPSLLLSTLPHGTKIDGGRYQIDYVLGRGSFGITYQAHSTRLPIEYAIKEFFPDNVARHGKTANLIIPKLHQEQFAQSKQKFLDEAHTLANLSHPHVVKAIDIFEERDTAYMVMELVEGQSLKDELAAAANRKLSLSRVTEIGIILVDALTAIHQQGIYHLDLKPENIMVTAQQGIVLVDFGSSRRRQFRTGSVRSFTTEYAPLELMNTKGAVGAYSDLFELGMLLHELITGKLPLSAGERVLQPELEDSLIGAEVPADWATAIRAAIALRVEMRPTSIAQWWKTIKPSAQGNFFSFETVTVNSKGTIVSRTKKQAEYITQSLGDGITLDMVAIPGGSFVMGSPAGEGLDREKPQHLVNVPSFQMGKYPITQSQYLAIMGVNLSRFQGGNLPVEKVSWLDATNFCKKLSHKTGKTYRLASEAQWEYACRAGTTTPFYFGETITPDLVNYHGGYPYGDASKGEYRGKTTEVGMFPPNGFGLYDMHGNVWEWCQDSWNDNYQGAPIDGSAWNNGNGNHSYLLRGGSWNDGASDCRSAYRDYSTRDSCYDPLGFRVVLVSPGFS